MHNLSLMPAGITIASPEGLLARKKIATMVAALRSEYQCIVIDAPPVLYFSDALFLSSIVDKVIVLYRSGKLPRGLARKALGQLKNSGAELAGLILNDVPIKY
jgi:Mrp family chromosome partitioning ATPase